MSSQSRREKRVEKGGSAKWLQCGPHSSLPLLSDTSCYTAIFWASPVFLFRWIITNSLWALTNLRWVQPDITSLYAKAHFSATVLGLLCWHSDVWCYETLLIAHTYTTQIAGRLGWGSNSLINRRQEKGDKFFCLSLPWPDGWLWITVYTYPEPQDGPKRLSNQSHVPVVGSIVYFHIGPLSFSALLLLSLPPVS